MCTDLLILLLFQNISNFAIVICYQLFKYYIFVIILSIIIIFFLMYIILYQNIIHYCTCIYVQ